MLRKLMKHEFRATGRIMLPLFLVVLVLSFVMAFVLRGWGGVSNTFLNILFVLISTGYGVALVAVFIVVMVLMVQRFRNNYLRDEGYVMFTLPVSTHQLVWSKAIVASVWFLATTFVVCLSAIIVGVIGTANVEMMEQFRQGWIMLWQELTAYYALNGTALFLEGLLVIFLSYMSFCVLCYASLAVGHGFDRHKMLLSVVFFFVFTSITQVIASLMMVSSSLEVAMNNMMMNVSPMAAIHLFMGLTIALEVIYGAVFYFITTRSLQKRLNIE